MSTEETLRRSALLFISVSWLLSVSSTAQQKSDAIWHFAVSGDSRNCGDIVMPAIAKSVLAHKAEFYWHLGDFRAGFAVDEDMQPQSGAGPSLDEYHKIAWDNFLEHQVKPFYPIPVHLGIGNHETYMDEMTPAGKAQSHADFIKKFSKWLDGSQTAYFRWRSHGVDFISLDNSLDSGFEDAQLEWLEGILKEDGKDPRVKSVVAGMHRALPNSLACGHSMNGDPWSAAEDNQKSLESGRRAYKDLWNFRETSKKHVYVLASHSHFYMQQIFNTPYWQKHNADGSNLVDGAAGGNGSILDGWLVGTAGAQRYRLPDKLPPDAAAITYAYGYLLGTVHANGTIDFKFEQVVEDDVPRRVSEHYGRWVDYCFLANRDDGAHTPVDSCNYP
jgi:hypothetical protein